MSLNNLTKMYHGVANYRYELPSIDMPQKPSQYCQVAHLLKLK